MKKKHILFIVENNPALGDPRVRGEMFAARDFGYHVSAISPRPRTNQPSRDNLSGIDLYTHPRPCEGKHKFGLLLEYLNAFFWESILAIRIFYKNPFDAIHAANPPDHIFLIALPFKMFGVRYIFDHHDLMPENYVAKFGHKGLIYHLVRVFEWLNFKSADLVISTNESYKNIATQRGRVKPMSVIVVRNGPDLTRIKPVLPNDRLRNGYKYLVGYVGAMGQQDDIDKLVEVVEYIVMTKQRRDIRFIVVGSGTSWKDMVSLSRKKGVAHFMEFTGYVGDETLWEIMSSVDVCVNPEFRNDFTDRSTMIKVMEYMTFSKPIVQFFTTEGSFTAKNAAVNVTENSIAMFGETLLEVLGDEKARKEMGAAGRSRIEGELQWEMQKSELKRAYSTVLNM